jgi:hypothetical protein
MNTRKRSRPVIAGALLFGALFGADTARAETDASLSQVFDAVCVMPVDAASRKAAALALGFRTPPVSFKDAWPSRKGATLELNVWKTVEGHMLIVYTMVEPIPGPDNLSGLSCTAMLSPGDPAALADIEAVLGLPFVADGKGVESAAFELTPDGRRVLDMNDDAAMDAAMRSGRAILVTLSPRKPKSDIDMIYLLRTQAR